MQSHGKQMWWQMYKNSFNQVNSGIVSLNSFNLNLLQFLNWQTWVKLTKIWWQVGCVGDLPRLHWAEADHWYPGCGTESVWTGACPTHWASDPGGIPWSSSSAHWYWHDAWASPPEAYRTPIRRKVERGKTVRRRGRVQGRKSQEIWQVSRKQYGENKIKSEDSEGWMGKERQDEGHVRCWERGRE